MEELLKLLILMKQTENKKSIENNNEITLKIKIESNDVNKTIYFSDNTTENFSNGNWYFEKNKNVKHNHDNLKEKTQTNAILIIDEKTIPFKKSFVPKRKGILN